MKDRLEGIQISLEIRAADLDGVESVLWQEGALSITTEDAGDTPLLEPAVGETPLWPRLVVTALFSGAHDTDPLQDAIANALGVDISMSTRTIYHQTWERAWMDRFHPMRFGKRLWVCPSNQTVDPGDATIVTLDPGLAFGTGTHATTALCLEWLDAHPPIGLRVIDYGCGSGILAIAALRLGAATVTALDNDPQALEATYANARKNAPVADRLSLCGPSELAPASAELVIANIVLGTLIRLERVIAGVLVRGGTAVLTGILDQQFAQLQEAYASRFEIQTRNIRDGWGILVVQRLK